MYNITYLITTLLLVYIGDASVYSFSCIHRPNSFLTIRARRNKYKNVMYFHHSSRFGSGTHVPKVHSNPSSISNQHFPSSTTTGGIPFQEVSDTEPAPSMAEDEHFTTLASNYVIDIIGSGEDGETWNLYPLQGTMGRDSVRELHAKRDGNGQLRSLKQPRYCLQGHSAFFNAECSVQVTMHQSLASTTSWSDEDHQLLNVLSRVIVQRLLTRQTNSSPVNRITTFEISANGEMTEIQLAGKDALIDPLYLFQPFLPSPNVKHELVEIVNEHGSPLAVVPRLLVHVHNMLHRGIGIVVLRTSGIDRETNKKTRGLYQNCDLYCHQRTFTKRIFPGLYDMFVGGVSSAGEDASVTAAREVAEELGLIRALNSGDSPISEPLFQCTVCTSYNRCVVTVFQYLYNAHDDDEIAWQEEEVAWGDFVPYRNVELAAELSIQRLEESSQWPGESFNYRCIGVERSAEHDTLQHGEETWDFVPDGLLVWQAWQEWAKKNGS